MASSRLGGGHRPEGPQPKWSGRQSVCLAGLFGRRRRQHGLWHHRQPLHGNAASDTSDRRFEQAWFERARYGDCPGAEDYGAYIVDSGGCNLQLFAEPKAEKEVAQMKVEPSWQSYCSLRKLVPLLRIVTNNGPQSVGGGGKPRRTTGAPALQIAADNGLPRRAACGFAAPVIACRGHHDRSERCTKEPRQNNLIRLEKGPKAAREH